MSEKPWRKVWPAGTGRRSRDHLTKPCARCERLSDGRDAAILESRRLREALHDLRDTLDEHDRVAIDACGGWRILMREKIDAALEGEAR